MRQVVENALGDLQVVILNDDVDVDCQIDGEAAEARLGQIPVIGKFAWRRPARLWIGAALLATAWASEVRGSSEAAYPQADARAHAQPEISASEPGFRDPIGAFGAESAPSSGLTAKSVRLAQAVPDNPEDLQKALEQEHNRAELLARELTIHRHLEMLLTLKRARIEGASSKQRSESERTQLQEDLQQERTRLKQAAERGATELCKVLSGSQSERPAGATDLVALQTSLQQEHERSERLKQDLATARRDVATQTALASKASDEASQAKGQAEKNAAELTKSLQQERERSAQLEKDLGAARRDVATQTALASKANEKASQAKGQAERDAAGLTKSLQQERERSAQLDKDLGAARRDVATQTALASKANEKASQAKGQAESDAAALRKSLQQERERAAQLDKDLAAARSDAKTAQASNASPDAAKLKQVADTRSAGLKEALQKEHERAEALARDLSTARAAVYAYEAQAGKASDQVAEAKQAGEDSVTDLRKSLQQEQARTARLEQDLAAARRDVDAQTALVAQAREDAAQSKQAAGNGTAELKRSLQKEHDRAEELAQNLSMVHTAVYTYEVQARMANDQAARAQSTSDSAAELRKLLLQEQARSAQLEQNLAASRRDVATQTALVAKASAEAAQLKQAAERKPKGVPAASGVATPVNHAPAAAARSNATPDPQGAAEVTRLVARASLLLGQGDIGSARIVLERAAETGNAQASFALAETYDPLILRKWGAYGTLGDAAKARDLYASAQAGGVKEAKERFDALRR
jgi:hypothetical protein